MKNQKMIELNEQELSQITGGTWLYDLGKAIGDGICAAHCAFDAWYEYQKIRYVE